MQSPNEQREHVPFIIGDDDSLSAQGVVDLLKADKMFSENVAVIAGQVLIHSKGTWKQVDERELYQFINPEVKPDGHVMHTYLRIAKRSTKLNERWGPISDFTYGGKWKEVFKLLTDKKVVSAAHEASLQTAVNRVRGSIELYDYEGADETLVDWFRQNVFYKPFGYMVASTEQEKQVAKDKGDVLIKSLGLALRCELVRGRACVFLVGPPRSGKTGVFNVCSALLGRTIHTSDADELTDPTKTGPLANHDRIMEVLTGRRIDFFDEVDKVKPIHIKKHVNGATNMRCTARHNPGLTAQIPNPVSMFFTCNQSDFEKAIPSDVEGLTDRIILLRTADIDVSVRDSPEVVLSKLNDEQKAAHRKALLSLLLTESASEYGQTFSRDILEKQCIKADRDEWIASLRSGGGSSSSRSVSKVEASMLTDEVLDEVMVVKEYECYEEKDDVFNALIQHFGANSIGGQHDCARRIIQWIVDQSMEPVKVPSCLRNKPYWLIGAKKTMVLRYIQLKERYEEPVQSDRQVMENRIAQLEKLASDNAEQLRVVQEEHERTVSQYEDRCVAAEKRISELELMLKEKDDALQRASESKRKHDETSESKATAQSRKKNKGNGSRAEPAPTQEEYSNVLGTGFVQAVGL